MCPSACPADLLPLLFPFCAVPKAFWQGSDFCAHSSVLKEKRGKTKGLEAQGGWWGGSSALGSGQGPEEHGDGCLGPGLP